MRGEFLKKADLLEPTMFEKIIPVAGIGHIQPTDGWDGYGFVQDSVDGHMQQGDSICLDFAEHCTGYVSFTLSAPKKYPDAPTRLRFKFAETLYELGTPFEEYKGGLSPAWLQEEIFVADEPDTYTLRRRYSFRYVKITVENANVPILLTDFRVRACSSADWKKLKNADIPDRLIMLDKIGCNTLSEYMQRVFEDGPKRDRRLWIGDLRLQALVNYETFDNLELVRRCLYLFAGHTKKNRHTPRCVFMNHCQTIPDAEIFVDYALMFCLILCEYYRHTGDSSFLEELFEIAREQLSLAVDMKEEALGYIQNYWGQMLKLGADTYWEVFVPGEPDVSPYGNRIINSACHAWSSSPSYFIRKYFTPGA